jgi:ABC-type multidrug transport system permease subunit
MREIEYKIGKILIFMLYFMAVEIYSLIMYHYTDSLVHLVAFIIFLNLQIFVLMSILFSYILHKENGN